MYSLPNLIVALAVGAIDGKHITTKKPKKSGNDCYNYKGYFSSVLLGASDVQIFHRSSSKENIKDGTLGLPPLEPLGEGGV